MDTVAVLDVGKTNVKLMAVSADGRLLETLSRPNPVFPGPPYRHHDLGLIEAWLVESLARLAARHAIEAIVATGHGSGGVLVGADGPLMPMIDYEQDPPDDISRDYPAIAGSFRERGSPAMFASRPSRQADAVAGALLARGFRGGERHLAHPQYWAWRLSGVLASEVTSLAAQSHLWCRPMRGRRPSSASGAGAACAALAPAWRTLGPLKRTFAAATRPSRHDTHPLAASTIRPPISTAIRRRG